MATIKSYTDLEQSKKLAEFLPLESSDMYWDLLSKDKYAKVNNIGHCLGRTCVYAWSLAALLNILPKKYYPIKDHETDLILGKPKDEWCVLYWDTTGMQDGEQTLADNPIDACYEMIIKLKELNLL